MDARECRALDDALEETNGHDVRGLCHRCRAHGQHGPQHRHGRQPVVGRDDLQHQVVWHLANDVAHGKQSVDNRVLLAHEPDILTHPRHIGILEVDSVQVVAPEQEAGKGEDEKVNLDEQLPLWLRRRALAPEHHPKLVQGC